MVQKYFTCGVTNEEFIEVLHRDENEHRRLVRHVHNVGMALLIFTSSKLTIALHLVACRNAYLQSH